MHSFRWRASISVWLILVAALSGILLAGCERDKGNPEKISREFIVALWTGDVNQVEALTCEEWRSVTTGWASEGNPDITVDTSHLQFDRYAETKSMAVVIITGLVTFKSSSGEVEVRDLDEMGFARITLVDEDGWKVCDVRGE